MAIKCGDLPYCGATAFDCSDTAKSVKCDCLTCQGKNCETCHINVVSARLQIDLLLDKCKKCKLFDREKAEKAREQQIAKAREKLTANTRERFFVKVR